MKYLLFAAALAAASTSGIAADVGVSVSIGQPGFYGQIDIGGYPPPQVIYRQPRRIEYREDIRPPIYLNVPPGHYKNWRKYCHRYDACHERVYFVRNNWYQQEYVPRYRERSGNNYRGDQRNDHHGDHRDHRDDHRDHNKDNHDNGNRHEHNR